MAKKQTERKEYGRETLDEIEGVLTNILQEVCGLDEITATLAAESLTSEIAERWGGQTIYLHRDVAKRASKKHWEIWEQFNGRNYEDLAAEFKCSVVWVRRVVKRMKALDLATRQGDLFGSPDGAVAKSGTGR
jgi:Mor family transcriptional regulator